jgi:RNA 2',3'-cyclic 3'-phosphodiesterase
VKTEAPEPFRLFVAVTVPEGVKDAIEKAQAQLRRAAPEGHVRWTRRDQLHVTLRFLGNVEAGRVAPLTEALQGCCQQFAPLHMRAEQIGFFPDSRFPRVVWVGVQDALDQLRLLQGAVQTATAAFTTEEAEERFAGHVTLGRVKGLRRPDAETLAGAAARAAEAPFGQWVAKEIEIIRSELSPKGALYTSLAGVALTGSPSPNP